MTLLKTHTQEKTKFILSNHVWLSLVLVWVIGIFVLVLTAKATNLVGIPTDNPYRPLVVPTLAHILVLFLIVPFVLQLPTGKTTFRTYLDEIRLTHVQPFLPLLILGISSSLILLVMLSLNSLIFRIHQGLPLTLTFFRNMIDLKNDLPPQSFAYIRAFPSIFEEISWRGVMLVLFRKRYSTWKSIVITSLGFGLFHFLNLIDGCPIEFVIRQIMFSSFLGFFYGYLVLRSNSLMPAMLFHYLVNMFIGSFTIYFQQRASSGTQILFSLVNMPLAVTILVWWVKVFCNHWIPKPRDWQFASVRRLENG